MKKLKNSDFDDFRPKRGRNNGGGGSSWRDRGDQRHGGGRDAGGGGSWRRSFAGGEAGQYRRH